MNQRNSHLYRQQSNGAHLVEQEQTRADIYKNMARLSVRFIEDVAIPTWARNAFQKLRDHLRENSNNLQSYKWPSLETILIWAFGEFEGKVHLEKIGKHATKADILKGNLLFHLSEKITNEGIQKIIFLREGTNAGDIIYSLLRLNAESRNSQYIALIEDIIESSTVESLNVLIFSENRSYSVIDLVKLFRKKEREKYAYGDHEAIISILESRGAKTTEEIQSELRSAIPENAHVYGKVTPFWASTITPKTSSRVNIHV